MDLILANGEGLQSVFVFPVLNTSPSGPESVRQLGDRENAFFVVLLAVLLAHLRDTAAICGRPLATEDAKRVLYMFLKREQLALRRCPS